MNFQTSKKTTYVFTIECTQEEFDNLMYDLDFACRNGNAWESTAEIYNNLNEEFVEKDCEGDGLGIEK